MIEMSHQGELPIHLFWPFRTHVSPSRFAVVVRPPDAPEPTSGSVRPKQPIFSKRAIGGNHFCFCSSEPPREMEAISTPFFTPKKVALEEPKREIFMATRPKNS